MTRDEFILNLSLLWLIYLFLVLLAYYKPHLDHKRKGLILKEMKKYPTLHKVIFHYVCALWFLPHAKLNEHCGFMIRLDKKMLLNNLHCTGQPLATKNYLTKKKKKCQSQD